ncbi:MAG TPA: ABC transporter substrate-binding protein, partial [Syntrophorhabdaceae bacterium]
MKRPMPYLILSLICAGMAGFFSNCYGAGVVKIGIVDTYTGPATAFTQDVLDGFKLAVDKINARGGVLGRKIEYTTRDEK